MGESALLQLQVLTDGRPEFFFVVVFPPGGGERVEGETEQEGASEDGGDVGRVALHEGVVHGACESHRGQRVCLERCR